MITIGADPEVFLERNGVIVPALGVLPGSKDTPHKTEHGWIQPDNALAEFNISPAASADEFVQSIKLCMQDLRQYGELRLHASHEFSIDELRMAGPGVFQFGCDPDFDAWRGGRRNRAPNPASVGGLRTAGGHIHIGCQVALDRPLDVVRGCDVLLGLGSVLFDDDARRRAVYGKAGAFRHKVYGVEYRTLSNFWLRSDDMIAWAYNRAVQVIDELDVLTDFCSRYGDAVQECINTSNKDMAHELLHDYTLHTSVMNGTYNGTY